MATKRRTRRNYHQESPFFAVVVLMLVFIATFIQELKEGQWWAIVLLVVLVLVIGLIVYFFIIKKYQKPYKRISITLRKVLKLTPTELEKFVACLYEAMGYKVEHIGKAGDNGVDVIAEKDYIRTAI